MKLLLDQNISYRLVKKLSMAFGHPPKLIWIKSGNLTTQSIAMLLLDKADQIKSFNDEPELSCLEIID